MTLQQALHHYRQQLATLESPFLEAELMLQELLGLTREQLHLLSGHKHLSAEQATQMNAWVARRLEGEPLAYIFGYKDFYNARFLVGPGVLVPRPESEIVIEQVMKTYPDNAVPLQIADFGAGSGCIGLSLLQNYVRAKLVAVEVSEHAFAYLKKNSTNLNLEARVELRLDRVEALTDQRVFDVIVANPPYIGHEDPMLATNVRKYEPHAALFSDEEGFGCLRRWMKVAHQALRMKGLFVTEIGCEQGPKMLEFLKSFTNIEDVRLIPDLSGKDRVVSWRVSHG